MATYIPPDGRGLCPLATGATQDDGREAIDDDILDEGCFYLTGLGMTPAEVASRFEISPRQVASRAARFRKRLEGGKVVEEPVSADFWKSIREEAEGNVKVTFVSEKGFHHSWRTDLRKLDGATLLSLYESCKDFLSLDPNARFLEYKTPKNYDPLAMQREITKAVVVLGGLLEEKWKEEKEKGSKQAGTPPNS
jgi:hypothetical protein